MKTKASNWQLYVIIIILLTALIVLFATNRPDALKKVTSSVGIESATLSGTLQLTTCGGAQPNYPDPPPCTTSVARSTTMYATRDGNVIDETITDANGAYNFSLEPGAYIIKVKGESSSEGHPVNLKGGKNEIDLNAQLHHP